MYLCKSCTREKGHNKLGWAGLLFFDYEEIYLPFNQLNLSHPLALEVHSVQAKVNNSSLRTLCWFHSFSELLLLVHR